MLQMIWPMIFYKYGTYMFNLFRRSIVSPNEIRGSDGDRSLNLKVVVGSSDISSTSENSKCIGSKLKRTLGEAAATAIEAEAEDKCSDNGRLDSLKAEAGG